MDLVTVSVDAVVYYRVEDPVGAETEIEEFRLAAGLGAECRSVTGVTDTGRLSSFCMGRFPFFITFLPPYLMM